MHNIITYIYKYIWLHNNIHLQILLLHKRKNLPETQSAKKILFLKTLASYKLVKNDKGMQKNLQDIFIF